LKEYAYLAAGQEVAILVGSISWEFGISSSALVGASKTLADECQKEAIRGFTISQRLDSKQEGLLDSLVGARIVFGR
jgi:hypothetical protein